MSAQAITGDFNNATDIFGGLFKLFTGGAGLGGSIMTGIANFLKFIFSWLLPSSDSDKKPTPTAMTVSQTTSSTSSRSFLSSLRSDWDSATDRVGKFFHGAAFDIKTAIAKIRQECGSAPGGHCLANVEDALTAGGLRFSGNRDITDVMPVRNGSHWAKDLAPVLSQDDRFEQVSSGYGASFKTTYTPKVGDIAVWTGGRYGHTQIFTGYDNKGNQVWISDFKTGGQNWTGLANPSSHGAFEIFRQKSAEDMAGGTQLKPQPRQNTPSLTLSA